MRRLLLLLCVVCAILALVGCKKATKTLICDGCGVTVTVEEDSQMTDDWIIYCADCNEKFFGDDPLLGSN